MLEMKEFIEDLSVGYALVSGCRMRVLMSKNKIDGRDIITIYIDDKPIMIFEQEIDYSIVGIIGVVGSIECKTKNLVKMEIKKMFMKN